jgi:2-methylcitrate dehydratase PrpD
MTPKETAVTVTVIERLTGWASTLQLDDVPARVVETAKSQILSQLAAALGGLGHPLGEAVVKGFGPPLQADPRRSACVLAGLTSWLHFDDTAYAGHLSNSTVNVPVAYAHALGLSGRDLLTAVIAANECAARVTAAATLGPWRGQLAPHTHLAGAVSGRLRSESAEHGRWVDALGLAFAMPPWPLQRALLGSDATVLSGFVPVRMGLDACDAAAAGLSGAPDIFEHPDGFLSRFASIPLPEAVTAGLGQRWHTDTMSFKVHPGGPGMDAAIDCAMDLRRILGEIAVDDVVEIVVHTTLYTVMVDHRASAYVRGPDSPLSALVFATPYLVASALLNGSFTPADLAEPAIRDGRRWSLAAKVSVRPDTDLTRAGLASEVPFGEALRQAGPLAPVWLDAQGLPGLADLLGDLAQPSQTFENATKAIGARVSVHLTNGRLVESEHRIPVGGAGPHTRAHHRRLVREKFLAVGGTTPVADAVATLESASQVEVTRLLEATLGGAS